MLVSFPKEKKAARLAAFLQLKVSLNLLQVDLAARVQRSVYAHFFAFVLFDLVLVVNVVRLSRGRMFLGVAKFRDSEVHEKSEVGLVTGLAWTEVGGSILTTEVQVLDGKGKMTITGQLGDVMQESAQAALSYIRGRAQALGLSREFYRNVDLHLHVPEGAIPKDGPSAGITMATALASALAKIPVRRDIAMTGEITLRGKVLAIGGLKEKLLAALRAGIFEVILPRANEKEIAELPDNIKSSMKLYFVDNMDEVLALALEGPLPAALPAAADVMAAVPPSELATNLPAPQ